jgi:DNA primase
VAANAPVSTPILWSEIEDVFPTDFDIRTLPERLRKNGELWSDILDERNDLLTIFALKK